MAVLFHRIRYLKSYNETNKLLVTLFRKTFIENLTCVTRCNCPGVPTKMFSLSFRAQYISKLYIVSFFFLLLLNHRNRQKSLGLLFCCEYITERANRFRSLEGIRHCYKHKKTAQKVKIRFLTKIMTVIVVFPHW